MGSDSSFVTVIMPIRNEAAFIERSLGSILAQDYPAERLEILVVDGMSDDGTQGIVQRMLDGRPMARLLENPGKLAASGLNVGVAAASGDVIVRVDGHTIIAPNYVRCCVEVLANTGADCAGGLMRAEGTTPFGEAVALATSHPFGIGGSRFHYATEAQEADTVYLGAWPSTLFQSTDPLGPFQVDVGCNEDDEFNYRLLKAGGRIWLDPSIESIYYCRPTLSTLFRQYFRYGYWKVRVFQKVPGSAQGRHWVPPFFVLGVVGGLLAAVLLPVLRVPYVVGLLAYALANFVVSTGIAAREGWRHLLRLPIVFATLHLAYGLGFWGGILRFGPPWRHERSDS